MHKNKTIKIGTGLKFKMICKYFSKIKPSRQYYLKSFQYILIGNINVR